MNTNILRFLRLFFFCKFVQFKAKIIPFQLSFFKNFQIAEKRRKIQKSPNNPYKIIIPNKIVNKIANTITLEMNIWRFCMHQNQQVILSLIILSSFSRETNLFASEIAKIASRYGFASGVSRPLHRQSISICHRLL